MNLMTPLDVLGMQKPADLFQPQLGKSLETKPNEAFFWSGRTNGIGGDLNTGKNC